MLVTLLPIVMLVSPVQLKKAESLMLVTLFGIVMLVRPVQLKKAESPMLVTLSEIVTLVKFVQCLKESVGTDVPVSTTEYVVFLERFLAIVEIADASPVNRVALHP